MDREVIDRWCERGILALVLAILVFGPLALGAVRGFEFAIVEGLTAGVILLWATRLWLNPRPQLLWAPICWVVVVFMGYAIGRYLTADIEYVARHELVRVLVYGFLFLAILNNLHRQESTQLIAFTLVFLAMAISFYAVYQFLTDSQRVWQFITPYRHRGTGTYINPNHLGGFLEMTLPLALTYCLVGRVKAVTRIFVGYAALAILVGIAVTVSKGAWVSSTVALLLLCAVLLSRRSYRLPTLAVLVVVVGASALVLPRSFFIQRRAKQLFTEQNRINDELRFSLWEPAWRMWQENPWWGVGPGHYDARFHGYRPEGVQLTPLAAHNDYLNTLADWGSVGAGLVAAAWVLLGAGVVRTRSSVRLSSGDLGGKSGSNKYALVLGACLGLIAILIHSAVDFNMQIPANAILTITLMALITSHLRFVTEKYWVRARLWVKAPLTIALLAGLVYLSWQGWRQGAEFVWRARAVRAPACSDAQIALYKRAFAIEPMNSQTAWQIGEALRRQSQEGGEHYQGKAGVNYRQLAQQAMEWFGRAQKLNRWDANGYAGYGWCLDWLDRTQESAAFFEKAEELDPNNYFNLNNIGLHYMQLGDYAAAKPWFQRSLRLEWADNQIATNYLQIANARLLEMATNVLRARLEALPP